MQNYYPGGFAYTRRGNTERSWREYAAVWIYTHWVLLLVAAAAIAAVGGGVFWRLQHRSEREIAAFAVLYRAGKIVPADAASLQSVLDRFPKTAAADVTRLKIAAV